MQQRLSTSRPFPLLAAIVGCVLLAACGGSPTPTSAPAATLVRPTQAPTRAAASAPVTGTQSVASASTGQTPPLGTTAATQPATTSPAAPTPATAPTAAPATLSVASIPPAAATSIASSPVSITGVQPNQADATVMVRNNSADRVNISGWHLLVGAAAAPLLDTSSLWVDPSQTITLHLALGTSTPGNVYLGQASSALARNMTPGQLVSLTDYDGDVASIYQIP